MKGVEQEMTTAIKEVNLHFEDFSFRLAFLKLNALSVGMVLRNPTI